VLPAEAALAGGANAVALINTLNSIIGVDLEAMAPMPVVDGKGTHGGYCGSAVKPIALHMVAEIARGASTRDLDISAIGGITNWHDAAEFIALGAHALQVCTAAMLYGFRIIEDMRDGLSDFMDAHGLASIDEFRGAAIANAVDWNELNMNYDLKASIDQDKCIECGRCHIVCEDTSHQAIRIAPNNQGGRDFSVIDSDCVGCNLCQHVCPVPGCITMAAQDNGLPYLTWPEHLMNPVKAAE